MPSVANPANALRVLIAPRPDEKNIFVAECLETGYIVTGCSYDEARENIIHVLQTEVLYAQEQGRKLQTVPVSDALESKWESVTSEHATETIPLFTPEPAGKKRPGRVANDRIEVARYIR